MTLSEWYGLNWDEVKQDLESRGISYTFQIIQPRGKIETWGNYRVVRLRQSDNRVDVILAPEKFSRLSDRPPV